MAAKASSKTAVKIPESLQYLFWDCDFKTLDFEKYTSFIIRRILEHGNLDAFKWLRSELGEPFLRNWLLKKNGGKLSPRRINFWGLILNLPEQTVDEWVKKARKEHWQGV